MLQTGSVQTDFLNTGRVYAYPILNLIIVYSQYCKCKTFQFVMNNNSYQIIIYLGFFLVG